MYISNETPEEIETRLLKVISKTQLKIFQDTYVFEEFPLKDLYNNINPSALAYVRDDDVWSQLVPSNNNTKELFTLISFHFKPNFDNSGFVGWLAIYLKQKLGTGVFVVCGQNSDNGGVFDYWGCPFEVGEMFIKEIQLLIEKGKQL